MSGLLSNAIVLTGLLMVPIPLTPSRTGWSLFAAAWWSGAGRGDQPAHQLPHVLELVLVDGVPEVGIEHGRHVGAQAAEDVGRVAHAVRRNVGVVVAAAQEHWRAGERPGVVALHVVGPDHAAAQAGH